jgi:putative phage-type endonuclease
MEPMIVDVDQGSAEWLKLRTGWVTGSRVGDVMAKLKTKNSESAARRDYRTEIVCEILTGRAADHYVSPAMQWGMDNEQFARTAYELEFDVEVDSVGFATHPAFSRFGASPDGLIGLDGVVEFKCPNTATHLDYILEGKIPPQYKPQMMAEIVCTGREWCDFVSFDPRLPKKLRLYVVRCRRDEEYIAEMEREVCQFLAEVDETIEILNKLASGMKFGQETTA